jgi:hypothetical protein
MDSDILTLCVIVFGLRVMFCVTDVVMLDSSSRILYHKLGV